MISYDVVTMGCKVNTYDTGLLESKLGQDGFVRSNEGPQVRLINSCAVTERSSLETHRLVKKIKALHPESVVVVTGCVAQVDVERLKTLTGADLIVGNSHKGKLGSIIRDYLNGAKEERVFHSNIFQKEDLEEGGGIESSRTRAFLKIQDGCNSFCTFCIIPFARGKSRSIPVESLVVRINRLYLEGFREIVLTGVHCGDYEDGQVDFTGLVEAVLKQTKMPRIRLSSMEPIEISDRLWALMASESRLCPHIHASIQSANSKVLKDMKRKYGQDEIRHFFERFKEHIPHGFIGMDVIAGFPGETEEEFEDTYKFLSQMPWTRIHVFPYSIRKGTMAAKRTDHLPSGVITQRARRLRELSWERQQTQARAQVGTTKKVLVLEKPSYGAQGLSRDYWPVDIQEVLSEKLVNTEIDLVITDTRMNPNGDLILVGQPVV